MNLQSITGIYPSNIGSYTQSITGVYNTNTGGGGEYINTDNNIVIDNVSNIINLSTNIITSLTDLSNNKQDNINLIAGNNISISNLNSSWTIEAIASGAEYSNPDNNLVINNVNDTINLSTTINVSNINTSSLTIPINSITKDKITNLNTSLDSLSGDITTLNTSVSDLSGDITTLNTSVSGLSGAITTLNTSVSGLSGAITTLNTSVSDLSGDITTLNTSVSGLSGAITTLNTSVSDLSGNITTLNTSVSDLSNNKQDNISLVAGNNISITKLNSSWTIEAIATGGQYSNLDNNLVINNVSDTINLSTTINITNLNTSSLTIPDSSISKNKIIDLNTSLDGLSNSIGSLNTSVSDLSNDKQDNITLIAGANISISKLNSSWTISAIVSGGSQYSNTDNNLVINNVSDTINLSTKINVSNISAVEITTGWTKIGLLTGTLSQTANFAHKNFFTNTGYALLQTNGGQTRINSNTDNIQVVKILRCLEGINCEKILNASDINTSNLSGITTYFNETNTSFLYVSIDANINNINSSNLNSSDINSRNINSSNIYTNILSTPEINVSSLGVSVLDATSINITNPSSFFSNVGTNYGELNTNSTKFNISCSNALYLSLAHYNKENLNIYSNNIDLNVSTNISGELNVSKISTSSVSSNSVSSSHISATNMSVLNDLSVGGVLTAPNINLTGLNTLEIGNALIGNNPALNGDAIFCHKNFNTSTGYMIAQDGQNGQTYINSPTEYIKMYSSGGNEPLMEIYRDSSASNADYNTTTITAGRTTMLLSQGKFTIKQESGDYIGNIFRVDRDGDIDSRYLNGTGLFQRNGDGSKYGKHHYGGWKSLSDDNLKHNEKPLEKGLEVISKLKPTSYDLATNIHQKGNYSHEEGFIAQEVYEIEELREAVEVGGWFDYNDEPPIDNVGVDGNKYYKPWKVNYSHQLIMVHLIKSVQQLAEKINNLEAENDILLGRVQELENV